ncbi:helix-turn-helix domain-containing protein [Nocardia sp. NPDC057030]|uniref:helix-turn-helix domain-containing protein n=1 Tax=unclassified Nocardia TaxID=2637762 RepID=UPI00363D3D7D
MPRGARVIDPATHMVAAAIRDAREEIGMTRPQLSAATGLSIEALRDIEWPRTAIDVRQLCAIAKALNTTIAALVAQVDSELVAPADLVNYGPDGQPVGVTTVTESDTHHAGLGPHVLAELAATENREE